MLLHFDMLVSGCLDQLEGRVDLLLTKLGPRGWQMCSLC